MNLVNPQRKVCLIGESAVGKTSIINFLLEGVFEESVATTIGSSNFLWSTTIKQKKIDLTIWDTAGQEKYRTLVPMFIRNAEAIIFVYDITKEETFERLEQWIQLIDDVHSDYKMFIVGNKFDLNETRALKKEIAEEYTNTKNGIYYETSAKTGYGINDLFYCVASELAEIPPRLPRHSFNDEEQQQVEEKPNEKNSSCC